MSWIWTLCLFLCVSVSLDVLFIHLSLQVAQEWGSRCQSLSRFLRTAVQLIVLAAHRARRVQAAVMHRAAGLMMLPLALYAFYVFHSITWGLIILHYLELKCLGWISKWMKKATFRGEGNNWIKIQESFLMLLFSRTPRECCFALYGWDPCENNKGCLHQSLWHEVGLEEQLELCEVTQRLNLHPNKDQCFA